ncbi:MAG: hypothetical protein JWM57_993, partial [Phycisphaerales bacterium]|nr:hypothetical protein [Phycisphaerales bacterium]
LMLKLVEGSCFGRFNAAVGRPRPYLLGCARQYARVIARSMWRQYLRDRGLPPMKSRKPKSPEDNDDAAPPSLVPNDPDTPPRPLSAACAAA